MNWKAEAIYNFVEYLKDTENIKGIDIMLLKLNVEKNKKSIWFKRKRNYGWFIRLFRINKGEWIIWKKD